MPRSPYAITTRPLRCRAIGGDAAMGYILRMESDGPDAPNVRGNPSLGSPGPKGDGKRDGIKPKFAVPPWYWLALVALMLALQFFLSPARVVTIPYSEFKTLVAAGKVREARVSPSTIDAQIDIRGAKELLAPAEYNLLLAQRPAVNLKFVLAPDSFSL